MRVINCFSFSWWVFLIIFFKKLEQVFFNQHSLLEVQSCCKWLLVHCTWMPKLRSSHLHHRYQIFVYIYIILTILQRWKSSVLKKENLFVICTLSLEGLAVNQAGGFVVIIWMIHQKQFSGVQALGSDLLVSLLICYIIFIKLVHLTAHQFPHEINNITYFTGLWWELND